MTMTIVDLRAEAAIEADRLTRARAVFREGDERALVTLEGEATWIAMPRRSRLKRALGGRVCLVWRAAFEDASGRLAESKIVPVLVDREWEAFEPAIRTRIEAECDEWAVDVARVAGAFTSARLARETDLAGTPRVSSAASQSGLFDRRAERLHETRVATIADCDQAALERRRMIANGATIARVRARLLLVLVS